MSQDEFKVYSVVKATRQKAGDIKVDLMQKDWFVDTDEIKLWEEIEHKLNDLECMLEKRKGQ